MNSNLYQEGNNQAKELVIVGFIEDLQNTLSGESLSPDAFKPWLREESQRAWYDMEKLRHEKNLFADNSCEAH